MSRDLVVTPTERRAIGEEGRAGRRGAGEPIEEQPHRARSQVERGPIRGK